MSELYHIYLHLLRASTEGVQHSTQNNIQQARQLCIRKITTKIQEHLLFPVKTQKRVEPVVHVRENFVLPLLLVIEFR